MRILLLLFLIFCTNPIHSQTIFTDLLQGNSPAPLYENNNYLYVGTFINASTPSQIFRIPVNDPTTLELVSEFAQPTAGIWKMTYDPLQNSLFAYDLIDLARVDLNQSLPITEVEILNQLAFCSGGITQKNGIVFIACINEISTIDTTAPNPTLDPFFSLSADDDIFNPVFYGDELYFSVKNDNDYNLYKIHINDPVGTFELVSTLEEITGGVQSSLIADNYLYLGIEGATHRILKLDLSNTNLPIDEEVMIDNFSGGPIGLARSGNRIFITDSNTQNIWEYTDTTLGRNDLQSNAIEIYPNPVKKILYLSGDLSNPKFMIRDLQNRQVLSGRYDNNGISIEALATGLYIISIEQNGRILNKKVIKR